MKSLEIGMILWISRFSPKAFTQFDDMGEKAYPQKKSEIFSKPSRYVIKNVIPSTSIRTTWLVEIEADAKTSLSHVKTVFECIKSQNQMFVGAASLSDGARSIKFELDLTQFKSGFIVFEDSLIISRKKSKNLQIFSRHLRKYQKRFKKERKYTCMNLITSCLMEIKTLCQIARMMNNNPERFV